MFFSSCVLGVVSGRFEVDRQQGTAGRLLEDLSIVEEAAADGPLV